MLWILAFSSSECSVYAMLAWRFQSLGQFVAHAQSLPDCCKKLRLTSSCWTQWPCSTCPLPFWGSPTLSVLSRSFRLLWGSLAPNWLFNCAYGPSTWRSALASSLLFANQPLALLLESTAALKSACPPTSCAIFHDFEPVSPYRTVP